MTLILLVVIAFLALALLISVTAVLRVIADEQRLLAESRSGPHALVGS